MFGLGFVEIALLALLIVLIFGAGPARRLAETAFKTYKTVNKTKQDLKDMVSLDGLLGKKDRQD